MTTIKTIPTVSVDTTDKLLFLLEAQLFHGCTKAEALMLWNDGIRTLYGTVETERIVP